MDKKIFASNTAVDLGAEIAEYHSVLLADARGAVMKQLNPVS
jgi:hypothetical protein